MAVSTNFERRRDEARTDFERHARFVKRVMVASFVAGAVVLAVAVWVVVRVTLHFT